MAHPLRTVLPDRVLVLAAEPHRRYEQLSCGHPGKLLANADARTHQQQQYQAHLAAGGARLAVVNMPAHWWSQAPWPRNPTRALRYDHTALATRRRCALCTAPPAPRAARWLEGLVSEPGALLDMDG